MIDGFLEEIRQEGKIRVLPSQEGHSIKKIQIAPIVTRGPECKIGVLIQDKTTGKSLMIEVEKDNDINEFISNLSNALHEVKNKANELDKILCKKSAKTKTYIFP